MIVSPQVDLQTLIIETMRANQDIQGFNSGAYDNVPADAPFPYVSIRAAETLDKNSVCIRAATHVVTLGVYSDTAASAECKNLAWAVERCFNLIPLKLNVHKLVSIKASVGRVVPSPDSKQTQGTVTITAIVEETQ